MKWIPIVLFVAALGCKKPQKEAVQQTVQDMRSGNTAPAAYVQDLQKDLKKAEDAAAKANAVIQQTSDDAKKTLEEAGQ